MHQITKANSSYCLTSSHTHLHLILFLNQITYADELLKEVKGCYSEVFVEYNRSIRWSGLNYIFF